MLSSVLITAKTECAVSFGGSFCETDGGTPLVLPVRRDGEIAFTVWGMGERDGLVPVPRLVRIAPEGRSANIPVVDWGDVIEAEVSPFFVRARRAEKPKLLDTAEFLLGDRRAAVELFADNGLNLAYTPTGGRTETYLIGEGRDGRLSVLDVGSARFLAVQTKTGRGERLVLLSKNAETVLDAEGDTARISEGRPTVVERLDTVRGFERRTKFEYKNGAFTALSKELGFYTREEHTPSTDEERALSAAEELRLGLDVRDAEFSKDALKDFLGDYDEARLYPLEESGGRVNIGLIKREGDYTVPRRFAFVMQEGRIADIEEL